MLPESFTNCNNLLFGRYRTCTRKCFNHYLFLSGEGCFEGFDKNSSNVGPSFPRGSFGAIKKSPTKLYCNNLKEIMKAKIKSCYAFLALTTNCIQQNALLHVLVLIITYISN